MLQCQDLIDRKTLYTIGPLRQCGGGRASQPETALARKIACEHDSDIRLIGGHAREVELVGTVGTQTAHLDMRRTREGLKKTSHSNHDNRRISINVVQL